MSKDPYMDDVPKVEGAPKKPAERPEPVLEDEEPLEPDQPRDPVRPLPDPPNFIGHLVSETLPWDQAQGSVVHGLSPQDAALTGAGQVHREGQPPPSELKINTSQLVGPLDAWVGKVLNVSYGSTHPVEGIEQAITVERIDVRWSTNNEPVAATGRTKARAQATTIAYPYPFPPRHDQAAYHVAAGDIVTVIEGRDGRCWYMSDDLPFPARVVKATGTVTEKYAGGAGRLEIKVRRRAITGDPSSVKPVITADLEDAEDADIEYSHVLVVSASEQPHGLRCGDYVWVERRGYYFFVEPQRQTFMAWITNLGPEVDEEAAADFGSEHYWLREVVGTLTYTNDEYSVAVAEKTQTDPTGSGGRYGRLVDGINLYERVNGTHNLPVDESVIVEVHMHRDPNGEVWYTFGHPVNGWFWSRLAGHASYDTVFQNRYKYAHAEGVAQARANAASSWVDLDGGRSGTTTVNPALNNSEDGQPQVYKVTGYQNSNPLTDSDASPASASPCGNYFENGEYGDKPAYERTDGAFWIWWYTVGSVWELSPAKGDFDPEWRRGTLAGAYTANVNATGTPTAAIADMQAVHDDTVVEMHYEFVSGTIQYSFNAENHYGPAGVVNALFDDRTGHPWIEVTRVDTGSHSTFKVEFAAPGPSCHGYACSACPVRGLTTDAMGIPRCWWQCDAWHGPCA